MIFESLNFKHLNSKRGFTLVETMVALVVLTMAIIPALSLSTTAANISSSVRDDLIAAGLAQEGVEVVRAIRDGNWFNGQAFDADLGDGSYRVEWNSAGLTGLGNNPSLNLNNGLYTYGGGTATKFRRTVTVAKINAAELRVVSQVSWLTRTQALKTTSAESHLFDWK